MTKKVSDDDAYQIITIADRAWTIRVFLNSPSFYENLLPWPAHRLFPSSSNNFLSRWGWAIEDSSWPLSVALLASFVFGWAINNGVTVPVTGAFPIVQGGIALVMGVLTLAISGPSDGPILRSVRSTDRGVLLFLFPFLWALVWSLLSLPVVATYSLASASKIVPAYVQPWLDTGTGSFLVYCVAVQVDAILQAVRFFALGLFELPTDD